MKTYTGDGTLSRKIELGLSPSLVIITESSNISAPNNYNPQTVFESTGESEYHDWGDGDINRSRIHTTLGSMKIKTNNTAYTIGDIEDLCRNNRGGHYNHGYVLDSDSGKILEMTNTIPRSLKIGQSAVTAMNLQNLTLAGTYCVCVPGEIGIEPNNQAISRSTSAKLAFYQWTNSAVAGGSNWYDVESAGVTVFPPSAYIDDKGIVVDPEFDIKNVQAAHVEEFSNSSNQNTTGTRTEVWYPPGGMGSWHKMYDRLSPTNVYNVLGKSYTVLVQ